MKDIKAMKLSLVKNYESIQKKIEQLLSNEVLDIKQISDLERFVNMQDTIAGTLNSLDRLGGF